MSTFSCPIVEIGKLEKHPNADSLSIVHIYSFPVIVRTGELNEGDRAVYIPEEALVPEVPMFSFLWKNREKPREKDRVIKAIRLRGIFSMGLLIPVPEQLKDFPVGSDVATQLGIEKYEKPEPVCTGGDNLPTPGWFHKYTEIEQLRKYNSVMIPGEEVVITEKIHGCLRYGTKIRMVDGTTRPIQKIEKGECVLGMNEDGHVVASKVLNTFNNGCGKEWLCVRTTRRAAGKGNSFASFYCTPNHQVYCPTTKEYVEAQNLKPGMKVLVHRNDVGLTPLQEQVLLGKVLGDGYIHMATSGHCAGITYSHCLKQKDYLEWTRRALGELSLDNVKKMKAGFNSPGVYRTNTIYSYFIKKLVKDFVTDEQGKKIPKRIPSWLPNKIAPIAVAFWYMDDGYLGHWEGQEDRAGFAVCAYTNEDCQILLECLLKFDIHAKLFYRKDNDKERPFFRLDADEAEKLFLLIAPYIPSCMQYKLPERYRGHSGWIPSMASPYKPALIEQEVLSVKNVSKETKSCRYDLETETHNFFVPDVLVHNSNGRFCYHDNQLWIGSHNNTKENDGLNMWWVVAKQLNLEERLRAHPDIIIFGEVYGQVQKGFDYDVTRGKIDLILFDAFDVAQDRYLNYYMFLTLAQSLELKVVPILYRGPWLGLEQHEPLADGLNTLSGKHIREGFVVKPVYERWNEEVGRVILKLVGQEYLLNKHKE